MKKFLLALLLTSSASAQINVQKTSGTNVISNGPIVVGNGNSITATGSGSIVATSGTATSVPWSGVTGTPTTLTGYGITNTLGTTAPLTGGGTLASGLTLSMPAATGSVNGYLTSTDWTTFNSKQGAIGPTTALVAGSLSLALAPLGVTSGGNGLIAASLGDLRYGSGTNTLAILPGNTSATMAVLTQVGNGTMSAAPAWTSTTGTGNVVRATSPTLVTPVLGNATATSVTGTSGLTLAGSSDGSTLVLGQGTGAGSLIATPTGTGGFGIGSQPVGTEHVNLWSNVSGIGGSTGVLRAAQFYAQYTGTNAFTALDLVADGQGGTYDHSVALQTYTKNTGTGNVTHMVGLNLQGTHTGSGTVTTADAIYWGGWTGSGTYTNKWFINSSGSTDNSWHGGGLIVGGKFVNGPGPGGTGTFGTYQGYINGINPVWEWANAATTTAFMGTASILFSGANVNDFGIMQNAAARSIILGVNAEKTLTVAKTNVALASTASLSVADGAAATPSLNFGTATTTGFSKYNATSTGYSASGALSLILSGGGSIYAANASTNISLGASSFTVSPGGTLAATFASTGVTYPVGKTISIASGTNQRAGNATLTAGTVTVSNTTVTANTLVFLTRKTSGGTLGAGGYTYTLNAGSSFTINAVDLAGVLSTLDTSVISYLLVEAP